MFRMFGRLSNSIKQDNEVKKAVEIIQQVIGTKVDDLTIQRLHNHARDMVQFNRSMNAYEYAFYSLFHQYIEGEKNDIDDSLKNKIIVNFFSLVALGNIKNDYLIDLYTNAQR